MTPSSRATPTSSRATPTSNRASAASTAASPTRSSTAPRRPTRRPAGCATPRSPAPASTPRPRRPPRRRRAPRDPVRQSDAARAADHLAAAGDPTGATAKLIQAAVDAAALGAAEQALAIIDDALGALDRLPETAEHRALRARALAEAARVQWTGVGPDARFTLEAAREAAAAAEAALPDDAPAALRGELASLRAHILHDVGGDALEEALALLTAASLRLEAQGEPLEAARLFNDQAAIWVRLGDPVRAHGLLEASRKVFAARADHDPLARTELADTEHLIARLPLHVAARPGRERDAAALGLRHAASAEASYAALDRPWDQARTWETLGRLELMRGRVDRAIEHLERAAAAQQQLGDVLGLAATVEALARALTAAGRPQVAIALLHDSLALNAEKGSLQGIGYLRRTVQALADALPPEHRHAMKGLLAEFEAEMRRVEEALQPG
ncbi:MAG: tetratricopeptide repeat protein [Myxococcales bacterium]|nr:tetratricopeptide repeat protein [Myxococcales bacterium]